MERTGPKMSRTRREYRNAVLSSQRPFTLTFPFRGMTRPKNCL
jgi:hypothetical protein